LITQEELSGFAMFKGLNPREVEPILRIAKEQNREAGEQIFEEKALATHMYLVAEGGVEIAVQRGDGTPVVVDRAGPGDVFGWSAITEPHTFTAGARAAQPTRLIVFEGEKLRRLFEANNHIGYRILKEVAAIVTRRLKARDSEFAKAAIPIR